MRFLLAILLLLIAAPAWAQQSQGMSQALVVSSCGGGTLPSGAVNQLTMDTTGRLCQSGIGSNVCPQATAYLARTVGGNEGGNAVAITALICGLVTDGVIDGTLTGTTTCGTHLDGLYVLAQQNPADALLNLCGTSYSLTVSATPPTFTSYVGYGGFAPGILLSTHFDPSIAPSPHYVRNSGSLGVWSHSVIQEAFSQFGQDTATTNSVIYSKFTSGNFLAGVNSTVYPATPTTITKGLFVADRSDGSNVFPYQNGVSSGAVASASAPIASSSFAAGPTSNGGGTAETISEAHMGGSLGATLNLALYNRLNAYMTAITPTGCPQATAYLARTAGGNEGGNNIGITNLICGLVSDGVIDGTLAGTTTCGTKFDALYVLAQQNAADAKLNLCGTAYALPTTTATFTAYKGFSAFPAKGIDTGFNANTAGVNLSLNAASAGVWVYNIPNAGAQFGTSANVSAISLIAKYTDGQLYCSINSSNSVPGGAFPGVGLFVCDRSSSANIGYYYNGTMLLSVAQASTFVESVDINIGDLNAGGFPITTTISEVHFGASLGATLELALYNRLRTYMTGAGVP